MNNNTPNVVTNFEQIIDIIEQSAEVNLYDTCAISEHEHVYHHHGELLANRLIMSPILLTGDIMTELHYEENERYRSYLGSFSQVLVIQTHQLYQLLEYIFNTKQAKARFRRLSANVFQTFVKRSEEIKQLPLEKVPSQIFLLYEEMFSSGKNKGEYSLLWLSAVLREAFPNLAKIRFLGIDQDLYTLVNNLYFKPTDLNGSKRNLAQIEIFSTETLLQALYRNGISPSELLRLSDLYRNTERKLFYYPIHLVLSRYEQYEPLSNLEFIDKLLNRKMEVLY